MNEFNPSSAAACTEHVFPQGSNFCIKCGARGAITAGPPSVPQPHPKSPQLFLLALLLPGLPQMILGQVAKGLVIFMLQLVLVATVVLLPIGFVTQVVFMVDASKLTRRFNRRGFVEPWEFMPAE